MPKQRVISPVETMQEKYETYRAEMARLKGALQQGFYFEAMLIEYALLEDRLRSFVYHAGLLQNRKASHLLPGKNAVRKDFNRIAQRVKTWKLEDGKETGNTSNFERLSVNKISDKIFIVRTIVLWSSELESLPDESRYLQALRGQCESLDAAALLETLDAIDTWRMYRNEVIHSLMNKRMESVQQKLSEQVEQGVQLARQLDAQVTILKKNNRIRKAARLPIQ
ncbi:MAG: hypothetical protein ACLU2C_13415 [Lachnospiraceae bacterium]